MRCKITNNFCAIEKKLYLCITERRGFMADNYLEKHYEEYEIRKAAWLKSRSKYPRKADSNGQHAENL